MDLCNMYFEYTIGFNYQSFGKDLQKCTHAGEFQSPVN